MKQKASISTPIIGMAKDVNMSQLQNTQYALAINTNTSNQEEGYIVQNEPSNYFGVLFPENYKVIGFIKNQLTEKTYYFLTSIETDINSIHYKRSSVGFVDDTIIETYNSDQECVSCDNPQNILGTPLELQTQTPAQVYVELENDRCVDLADIEDKGFNFNVNFPIKKIEIKQEKLGTTLYWNDNRNPFRYLQIGRIEEAIKNNTYNYLRTQEVPCDDPTEAPCLDVDKMLVFPKYKRMVLEADKEQVGGNLKQGTYEFWGAYCDLYGNEITEYSTPTNPISIWDENNYIQSQVDTDDFTNYAIKIKVDNLDIERFKYYKIAVVERNNVNNTQSVFLAGIYPTTDNVVVYTHSASNNDDLYITRGNVSIKKRMDFETLTAIKPQFKRMKGTMVSDDRLFGFGLEVEEEINLQPVVNLFSSLVKAQTSVADENLYKSAIATSKYKQYSRNEVQPLAIRFLYDDGGYSSNFPFVGRPKNDNDAIIISDSNINKASLIAGETACGENTRTEKWQIFNTAVPIDTEDCFNLDDNSIELPAETIEKTCYVDINTVIPEDTITLALNEDFYDLETYINDHIEDICNVASIYYNATLCDYLGDTYPETCEPSYIGECTTPTLKTSTVDEPNPVNQIKNVVDEIQSINYKNDADYQKSVYPQFCNPYKRDTATGGYIEDTSFMNLYSPCIPTSPSEYRRWKVYQRDSQFVNEDCAYASSLPLQTEPSQSLSTVFLNYQASELFADLVNENVSFTTTIVATGFHTNLHNKAQFFKVSKNSRDKIVFEITKKSDCLGEEEVFAALNNKQIRYVIYDDCNTPTQITGGIVNLDSGLLLTLDVTAYPEDFIIAIDTKIVTEVVREVCDDPLSNRFVHYLSPPCGCFSVYQRNVEPTSVTISWSEIQMRKKIVYESSCTTYLPKVSDCDPIPYKKYKMAYWESVVEYPDNKQLYDSSFLKVRESDLSLLSDDDKLEFEDYFTQGLASGIYSLKPTTDLRCQPIRHPKFPDNTIAPFMIDNLSHRDGANSIIFPMGINFDSKIVQTMLEVAYYNGLINKKQKEKIVGWEILKGDNSIHKSVTSSGILYDVYKYNKNGEDIHFSNFPFNDLGENKFINDPTTKQLIQHPFGGEKNNKFTYLSPDIFLTKPALPTEMSLQGYVFGGADIAFADVEKHPKWTVLGRDTYTLSEILAGAEVVLEIAIKLIDNQIQANQGFWFWSFGGPAGGGFATGAAGASASTGLTLGLAGTLLAQGFVKYGEYRYNWIKIFRDLGRMDNFASFQYGAGKHNRFLKISDEDDNYLRRLPLKKYLRDGDFTFTDENDGTQIKLNHNKREASVFLSTGDFPIEYPAEYANFDNNKVSSLSSNFTASETNCQNNTINRRNIANPYVQLKNYIPDQWDTIDSIKWLTTNYIFDLQEDTTCKVIYGGSQVISRFSWRVKVPFFSDDAIGLADKLPYLYSKNSNIGEVKYYCNYETADDVTFRFLIAIFPDIRSDYNFDCQTGRNSFYLRPPSKFYLFTHGIIDFLVESEINCNFRYGRKEPKDQFYKNQNLSKWLQEVNLPMIEPNTFFYNNSYTFPVSNTPYKKLDRTYDKDVWNKRNMQPNAWIWSEKDVNENALIDPWLIYKPLNYWEDKTNRGELIDLRSIESGQFLGRYENELQLFNPANVVADAINTQNRELGTGFMSARPISFKKADLGFAGTQNTDFVSTPYGHFWCDAKRGRIFQIDQSGGNMEVISEVIQGKPSNIKQWFREHLPFKILKQFPQTNIDNKFKGLGLNMWYDDRQSRVFITKRDYIAKNTSCLKYDDEIGFYNNCENCSNGLDAVFIVDGTGSQGASIENIKDGIQTQILPAIESNFGTNYRIALIVVKDRRRPEQSLFDIVEPFNLANADNIEAGLAIVSSSGGHEYPEPTDMAILAALNNTTEINYLGASVGTTTIGEFRDSAAKAIFVFTDATPSGLSDSYEFEDWLNIQTIATIANTKKIQIFTHLTTNYNPAPVAPILTTPPNISYLWSYLATETGGQFSYNPNGTGLTQTIVNTLEDSIVCDNITPVYFDNEEFFDDVSWTISYKPTEGVWSSFFTFYPDFSPYHQEYFQVGYNWGKHKGTMWNHLMNNNSFGVFQGEYNPWILEFPVTNEGANKILNSVSINIEARRYNSYGDFSIHKDIGVTDLFIYNQSKNTGYLVLHPQKTLTDSRKYPQTIGNKQHILTSFTEGKQMVNTFFNRVINQDNNVPMFKKDANNIFKTIDPRAVRFGNKKILERMSGEVFIVNISNTQDSRFNILIKNTINLETVTG